MDRRGVPPRPHGVPCWPSCPPCCSAGCRGWDLGLAFVLYLLTAFGITVGYHRLFTHGSFKARRPLRLTLAVLGSLALEGQSLTGRRPPQTPQLPTCRATRPWRYGTSHRAVAKGLVFAHIGWLRSNPTDVARYAPT